MGKEVRLSGLTQATLGSGCVQIVMLSYPVRRILGKKRYGGWGKESSSFGLGSELPPTNFYIADLKPEPNSKSLREYWGRAPTLAQLTIRVLAKNL